MALYSILIIGGIFSSIYVGLGAYLLNPKGKANRLFLTLGILGLLWNSALILRSVASTPEIAYCAMRGQAVIAVVIGAVVMDVLHRFSASKYPRILNYVPAALLSLPIALTGLIISPPSLGWYSFAGAAGPFAILLHTYFLGFIAWSGVLMAKGWGRVSVTARKYFRAILVILIPALSAGALDAVLFALGIPYPNLANAMIAPTGLVAFYIFQRYGSRGEQI